MRRAKASPSSGLPERSPERAARDRSLVASARLESGSAAERGRAHSLAQRELGARERTVAELRGLLERREIGAETIEAVVGDLLEAGMLDDARYARVFSEDRRLLDRWGTERIERDLLRRGVDGDVVAAALAGHSAKAELGAALSLLADRFPSLADDRERERAWRVLVRRGYAPELAYEAVRSRERDLSDAI